MIISDSSGFIEIQYLYSSVLIKMDRYNVYLKQDKLVELKNILLDCLRTLRENEKNKALSEWLKEKSRDSFGAIKNTMMVDVKLQEVCIKPPSKIRSSGPIGRTNLTVYLRVEDLSCFIRKIKTALLQIRLKAKQKCQ